MSSFLASTLVIFLILALSGCNDPAWEGGWGVWDGEIISRVSSPDKAVDAIIVEGSAGATSGFSSRVFLVLPGTDFDNKSGLFDPERTILRADGVEGLTMVWKDTKTLEITYKSARILHYSNFADLIALDKTTNRYKVRLVEPSK